MAGRRDIQAGKAYVSMYVRNKGLIRGLRNAQARLRAFGSGMQAVGMKMMAIGGSITAPLLLATKQFMSMGDEVAKMSIRVGFGIRALSELGFAAEQSGSNLDQLGTGLFRMIRRVANASTGTGPAVRALEALGLVAEDLTRLSPEKQFYAITDALEGVENESLAAQYAFELFGLGARQLLPLLREGTAGMDKLRKEARALGRSISPEDAAAAAALTDAWNRLMSTLKGAVFQIGSALASSLELTYDKITEQFKAVVEWIKENKGLIVSLLKLGVGLTAVGAAAAVIGTGIVGLSAVIGAAASVVIGLGVAFSVAATVIGAILSPIGLVVAAVVGLGVWFAKTSGIISGEVNKLRKLFDVLLKDTLAAFDGIANAMKAGDLKLATEILWAFIEVQWQHGLGTLEGLWTNFENFWLDGIDTIKLAWADLVGSTAGDAILADIMQREIDAANNVIAAQARLDAARQKLSDLNRQAGGAANRGPGGFVSPGENQGKPLLPTVAAMGGTAVGTFSAAQSSLLGGGGIQSRQLKVAEKQLKKAEELIVIDKNLLRETKKGRLVATA